ncbi:MAG: hypothetical protein K6A92_11800 [Lachnospiraceae bacterium]|nr:hypothetical protein [Lachnospiraceae bacterium]
MTKIRWISIGLLSVMAAILTMYGLRKPASAISEDGAGQIGLFVDAGDLIPEDYSEPGASDADGSFTVETIMETTAGETESVEAVKEEDPYSDGTAEDFDAAGQEAGEDPEGAKAGAPAGADGDPAEQETAASNFDETEPQEADTVETDGTENDFDETETESEETAEADETEGKQINLADYITETLIQRKNADGTWSDISEEEIRPGDNLRITVKYTLPEKASSKDQIIYDVPDEFGQVEQTDGQLNNGQGSYRTTGDGQIQIEYQDELSMSRKQENVLSCRVYSDGESGIFMSEITGEVLSPVYLASSASDSFTYETTVAATSAYASRTYTITGVSAQVSAYYYDNWHDIQDGEIIGENSRIRFFLDYVVPRGSLDASTVEGRTITYHLKEQAGITPLEAVNNGLVYNAENKNVGTYTITAEGLVTIVFFEEFAKLNQSSDINGDFNFTCLSTRDNNEDSRTYRFSDDVAFTVYFEKSNEYSLDVAKNKEDSTYNEANGTFTYVIYISSEKGTDGAVTLKDVMTVKDYNYQTDSSLTSLLDLSSVSIRVTDVSTGRSVSGVSTSRNGQSFDLVIPQMAAGSNYKVTYTVTVPAAVRNATSVTYLNNSVRASYPGGSDKVDGFDYTFDHQPDVNKWGSKTGDHEVTWTIILNSLKRNLKGYTLVDKYSVLDQEVTWKENQIPLDGQQVTMTDSSGKSKTVTLPYTFKGNDYNTYTITYTQTYTATDLMYGSLKNTAYLLLDIENDESGGHGEGSVYVGKEEEKTLEKEASGEMQISTGANGNPVANIRWDITLIAPISRNENNNTTWSYNDTMSGGQVITTEELSSIQKTLRSSFDGSCVVSGVGDVVNTGAVSGYQAFRITFYKDLTSSIGNITFSYYTKADLGDGSSQINFQNTAWVYSKKYEAGDDITYYPGITKYDGYYNEDTQTYDYFSSSLYGQGIIPWILRLNLPSGYNSGDITIDEMLPDTVSLIDTVAVNGQTLHGLIIADNAAFDNAAAFSFNGDSGSATLSGVTFSAAKNSDGTLRIIVPQSAAGTFDGRNMYIKVLAKIKDSVAFTGSEPVLFTNGVQVRNPGGEMGSDFQSQKITKISNYVTKTSAPLEGLDAIRYVVDINEGAADLLKDKDTLELTDILKVSYGYNEEFPDDYEGRVDLVPNSLVIYEVDAQGNEILLDPSEYSVTTDTAFARTGDWPKYTEYEYLYLTVPDERHLRIRYTYQLTGPTDYSFHLDNKITLEGVSEGGSSDETQLDYKMQNSSAHANVKGITVYKTDWNNENIHLPGAVFALAIYNGETFVPVEESLTTDEEGKISLGNLKANTAYCLTEITPPEGYFLNKDPTYFYLAISTEEHYEDPILPAQFSSLGGIRLTNGQNLYVKDMRKRTSITVEKLWAGDSGNTTLRPTSILVKVGRRLGTGKEIDHTRYYSASVLEYNGNSICEKITNYPSLESGSVVKLTFTYTDEYNTAPLKVLVNGTQIAPNETAQNQKGPNPLTYSIPVTGHTVIRAYRSWSSSYYLSDLSVQEAVSEREDSEIPDGVETSSYLQLEIKENSAGRWFAKLEDLDKYYQVTDSSGAVTALYEWQYYVSEYSSLYYTPSYSENNLAGINEGTIVITNTRNEEEQYVLPQTGGRGTFRFLFPGCLFMAAGGLGYSFCKRKSGMKSGFGPVFINNCVERIKEKIER